MLKVCFLFTFLNVPEEFKLDIERIEGVIEHHGDDEIIPSSLLIILLFVFYI